MGHGHGARDLIDHFTVLEDDEGGDGANAEQAGNSGVFVHIDLAHEGFAFVFGGQFLHDGADAAAGAAPGGPEVDENGNGGLDDDAFKSGISNCGGHDDLLHENGLQGAGTFPGVPLSYREKK